MPRYVALLRGVSPMNLKMPDLARALEASGFEAVKTVLSSGNVAFDAARASDAALARAVEAAVAEHLGRTFRTLVRPRAHLLGLLDDDPFAAHRLPADAKRVVTFLATAPSAALALPVETDGVRVLEARGAEVFTAYVPHPRGPVFMKVLEDLFGTEITTRTWDTVRKCAAA